MNTKILFVTIFLSTTFQLKSQVSRNKPIQEFGYLRTIQNDSISVNIYPDYRRKIYEDSIAIQEFATISWGSHWEKNGVYIERSINGRVLTTGRYYRNHKIGQWVYFYKSGEIKRIENYILPFPEHMHNINYKLLQQIGPFLSGNFLEFHINGNIKTIGTYTLLDLKRSNFTITDINYETYEDVQVLIQEEFWVPTSLKTGTWLEYDTEGILINRKIIEEMNLPYRNTPHLNINWDEYEYITN